MVQTWTSDHINSARVLTHLSHSKCGTFICDEVYVRHLRDGVTNGFVECAFGGISACDVRHGDVVYQTGFNRGQVLKTISEYQGHLRTQLLERIGHSDDAQP